MPWILPKFPLSSLVKDESPFPMVRPDIHNRHPFSSLMIDRCSPHIVEPSTQELQNIKNMISRLQLDMREERCKRECLEEKLRKFEGNLTRQSHESPKRKLRLPKKRELDDEIPQNQSFLPGPTSVR
jgi:hypothetical protein